MNFPKFSSWNSSLSGTNLLQITGSNTIIWFEERRETRRNHMVEGVRKNCTTTRHPATTMLVEPRLGFLPNVGIGKGETFVVHDHHPKTGSGSNANEEVNDTAQILKQLATLSTSLDNFPNVKRHDGEIAYQNHIHFSNQEVNNGCDYEKLVHLMGNRLSVSTSPPSVPIVPPQKVDFRPYNSQPMLPSPSMAAYLSGLRHGLTMSNPGTKNRWEVQQSIEQSNQSMVYDINCDALYSDQILLSVAPFTVGASTSPTPDSTNAYHGIRDSKDLVDPTSRPSKKNIIKICRMEGCFCPAAKRTPYCSQHSGPRRCEFSGCEKGAQGRTRYCISHGGGRRCIYPSCNKGARDSRYCAAHGGGRRCEVNRCSKSAVGGSRTCTAHGGGKRCQRKGCVKSAQSATPFCVKHGGGRKCAMEGCDKVARGKTQKCMVHSTLMCLPISTETINHLALP